MKELPSTISVGALVITLGLIAVGSQRFYEVQPQAEEVKASAAFDPNSAIPGVPPAAPAAPAAVRPVAMGDIALVENTTFTGVVRQDGKLTLTYDPKQKRGKQACPT